MTYTKAYRHRIYKKALKAFDGWKFGLCSMIWYANDHQGHLSPSQSPMLFPELLLQKPKGAKTNRHWWSKSTRGHNARRRALVRCIELTAPTPRKKP